MEQRRYVRLYAATVVVGLAGGQTPDEVAMGMHDALVAAGFDISNVVGMQRTTKKQLKETFKASGLV